MAKQTFTTGQVLTAAQMTSLQQTAMLGGAASAKTASYTLVAADAGTAISMSNASATTITVNTALFAAGDTVQITNIGAGVCTITAGTATVNTASSLALAQYESGTLDFTSTSAAIFIKGAGAAAGGGGKVLQVVSLSTNNAATTTGTSFVDASVSLSITPTLNTSKVLALCAIAGSTNAQNSAGYFTIYRSSTNLGNATNGFITVYHNASYSGQFRVGVPMTYLDSPATTSATTYAVYFKTNGVGTVQVNSDTTNSTITLLEIGA